MGREAGTTNSEWIKNPIRCPEDGCIELVGATVRCAMQDYINYFNIFEWLLDLQLSCRRNPPLYRRVKEAVSDFHSARRFLFEYCDSDMTGIRAKVNRAVSLQTQIDIQELKRQFMEGAGGKPFRSVASGRNRELEERSLVQGSSVGCGEGVKSNRFDKSKTSFSNSERYLQAVN